MPAPSALLDATVGGTASNSYLTIADADSLVALLVDSGVRTAWAAYTSDIKARGLMAATKMIDSNRFQGFKFSPSQALQFPRSGQDQASTQIPPEVLDACLDQAINLLANSTTGGFTQRQLLKMEGVTQYQIGSFSETLSGAGVTESQLSTVALVKLDGWISRTGRTLNRRDVPRVKGSGWYPFQ